MFSNTTMDSATDNTTSSAAGNDNNNGNVNKRQKHSNTSTITVVGPLARCKQIAQLYVKSLPPSISRLALSFFDEFIKLQQELLNLRKRKDKLSDPNYNFKSGHVNFSLTGSNRIKDTEAFTMKSNECKEKILELQSFLQLKCIETIDLEIEAVNKQLRDRFCYWLFLLSTAICKYHNKSEDKGLRLAVLLISRLRDSAVLPPDNTPDEQTTITSINDCQKTNPTLFKYSGFPVNDDSINTVQGLVKYLFESTKQTGDVPIHNAFSTLRELRSIHLLLHPLSDIMTTLFYDTWKEFLDAKAKQERDAALTTWVETTLHRDETAEVAMELDNLNLQSPQLGELIDTHIDKKFKRVENKLKTIVNTQKNSRTGASNSVRIQNKSKPSSQQSTRVSNNNKKTKKTVPKADAAGKGSTNDKQNNSKKNQKKSVSFGKNKSNKQKK
jgi:hypothetical protein